MFCTLRFRKLVPGPKLSSSSVRFLHSNRKIQQPKPSNAKSIKEFAKGFVTLCSLPDANIYEVLASKAKKKSYFPHDDSIGLNFSSSKRLISATNDSLNISPSHYGETIQHISTLDWVDLVSSVTS